MFKIRKELGSLLKIFRPGISTIIAQGLVGVLLFLAGPAFAYSLFTGAQTAPDGMLRLLLIFLAGVAAPAGGIALLFGMRKLISTSASFYSNGIIFRDGKSFESWQWSQVVEIRELFTDYQLKTLKKTGVLTAKLYPSISIVRDDAMKFELPASTFKNDIPAMLELLRDASDAFKIEWKQLTPYP